MDELTSIAAALENCFAEPLSTPPILATVVDVDGSSYRRPGARMLILPSTGAASDGDDGEEPRRIGMISGGCLERELCRTALYLTQAGPRLVSFDSRENRLQPAGRFGSGCHGLIHVLLEPIPGLANRAAMQLCEVARSRRPRAAGVVCGGEGAMPHVGTRFEISEGDEAHIATPLVSARLSPAIDRALRECQTSGRSIMIRFTDGDAFCEVFFQRIEPAPPLWIFGAGDDAIPLALLAATAGMRVTVFDKQAGLVTAERFGLNIERHLMQPSEAVRQLTPCAATSIVLMTHSLTDDAVLLPWAVRSPASYIGLLGPKRRTGRVLQKAHEQGSTIRPEHCENLRTPAGLDLGAANAAEIGVSILAEIIATRSGREGRPLLHRTEPIHAPAVHDLVDIAHSASRQLATRELTLQ